MVTLLCRNRLCSEIPEPGRLRLLRKFSITHLRNHNVTLLLFIADIILGPFAYFAFIAISNYFLSYFE